MIHMDLSILANETFGWIFVWTVIIGGYISFLWLQKHLTKKTELKRPFFLKPNKECFLNILLSVYIWLMMSFLTIMIFFGVVLKRIVFRNDKLAIHAHKVGFWWANLMIRLNPLWSVDIQGLENIPGEKTRIFVSNHASMADILISYEIKKQFKWIAKKSLFKIPFLGGTMRFTKHISLRRNDLGSIREINRKMKDFLDQGMSLFIFPEGTRSRTGNIQPFKNGAFKLAIEKKISIVPIAILGSFFAFPTDTWIFNRKVQMTVKVFPEIDASKFEMRDHVKLKDMVYELISKALEVHNQPRG